MLRCRLKLLLGPAGALHHQVGVAPGQRRSDRRFDLRMIGEALPDVPPESIQDVGDAYPIPGLRGIHRGDQIPEVFHRFRGFVLRLFGSTSVWCIVSAMSESVARPPEAITRYKA